MKYLRLWFVLVLLATSQHRESIYAEDSTNGPVATELVCDWVNKLTYADGTIKLDVNGRRPGNPLTLSPSPALQQHPEPKPNSHDQQRGYVVFVPNNRRGVLPEYRPSDDELEAKPHATAARDEFELMTLCLRPLRDLGSMEFEVGEFKRIGGRPLDGASVDLYIAHPTVEQIQLSHDPHCRWVTKWLSPMSQTNATTGHNVQIYIDVYVPKDAPPGVYTSTLYVRHGDRREAIPLTLKVLPLTLGRPMPWGMYDYSWSGVEDPNNHAWHLFRLKELRRGGLTHVVISPLHYQNRPMIRSDGTLDWSVYDHCLNLYREAGFEDPAIVAMEGLMFAIAAATGMGEKLGFTGHLRPGVKAQDIPDEFRQFAGKAIRNLYEHAVEAKWPPFYAYYADEPHSNEWKAEKAKFMYGLSREVAPEMPMTSSAYSFGNIEPLKELLDFRIVHYIHPCLNKESNAGWITDSPMPMYGIEWIIERDSFWDTRYVTFLAIRGHMSGMTCWAQWNVQRMISDTMHPYEHIRNPWDGGPWVYVDNQERMWRSLPWLGVREGIDDSRYVQTVRSLITKGKTSEHSDLRQIAQQTEEQLDALIETLPFYQEFSSASWNSDSADEVRWELAHIAINLDNTMRR